MSAAADGCAVLRFSTNTVPERDRATVVRDFYGPLAARVDFEPDPRERLYFEAVARVLPDLAVSNLAFSALRAERTRELAADGNDSCIFSVLRSSGTAVVCRGREATPAEGAATLLSMADPFVCTSTPRIARGITLTVPRKVLAASVPRLEDSFGLAFPNSEALRLLASYVALLEQDHILAAPDLCRLVVTHVHDLIALALGASNDAAETATGRGLRAARRHAIKADIRASLGEQGLSLSAIAARHGITPRYVQALFADESASFSQFLLDERLARVHRMLLSPVHLAGAPATSLSMLASAISPTSTALSGGATAQRPPTCAPR